MSKECLECEREFTRKTTESNIEWSMRRYCSARCGLAAAGKAGASGGAAPKAESYAAACGAHLRALLRYGLRNDGLPGLAANDLLRMAAEMGVAA